MYACIIGMNHDKTAALPFMWDSCGSQNSVAEIKKHWRKCEFCELVFSCNAWWRNRPHTCSV
jgi:hypothetical protein